METCHVCLELYVPVELLIRSTDMPLVLNILGCLIRMVNADPRLLYPKVPVGYWCMIFMNVFMRYRRRLRARSLHTRTFARDLYYTFRLAYEDIPYEGPPFPLYKSILDGLFRYLTRVSIDDELLTYII